ncbi:MAG: HAMP domain-containing sensor histidine kinase [Vicinamibacterales bacterium]
MTASDGTREPTSSTVWYRSFYWRIALGFIACVAAMLLVHGVIVVYLATRERGALAQSPQHFATVIASDLSQAIERDPAFDIESHLRGELGNDPHAVVVLMRDGRALRNRDFPIPDGLLRFSRGRLRHEPEGHDGDRRWRGPTSPVVVGDRVEGIVIVIPPGPFPFFAARAFGPTLGLTSLAVLVLGTTAMAFFVFRPTRRRLLALQEAASALGAGRVGVRAREDGGDEVASLARAFNRMAAELEARVSDLEESDRVRRQLLADVSHELMTPLTAMRGYLETLGMPAAVRDEATRHKYLGIVTEETERLAAIVGDLLDIARLGDGGVTMARERVAVQALFERAAARHGTALAEKHIALTTAVAPGAAEIIGDERRLEQAVQNLVANAVRHTPSGGSITLAADREPLEGLVVGAVSATDPSPGTPAVRVSVRDTGPGIPADHLPRIFDRFYRVDAARDAASGGSGLGLSIVRAIVEAQGGRVAVASVVGTGTLFQMSLPG